MVDLACRGFAEGQIRLVEVHQTVLAVHGARLPRALYRFLHLVVEASSPCVPSVPGLLARQDCMRLEQTLVVWLEEIVGVPLVCH
jgi:hypothetical protein